MRDVVVDTNVPIVANGRETDRSQACADACVERLGRVMREERIRLDAGGRVLLEYLRYRARSGQPRAGDLFIDWLMRRQATPARFRLIALTPRASNGEDYEEFPDTEDLRDFDRSDRKFVALALAGDIPAPVLNAADTDWWNHRQALKRHGVHVEFLCEDELDGLSKSKRRGTQQ